MTLCPCNSGNLYNQCCGLFLDSESRPDTPQKLMRSRYCAYVAKDIDYIYQTYARSSRAQQSKQDIQAWAQSVCFINLEILSSPQPANDDNYGYVEFVATYIDGDMLCKLQEKSRFIRTEQTWLYLDGQITPHAHKNIGRNESCPCGSGKKFKRCHG